MPPLIKAPIIRYLAALLPETFNPVTEGAISYKTLPIYFFYNCKIEKNFLLLAVDNQLEPEIFDVVR